MKHVVSRGRTLALATVTAVAAALAVGVGAGQASAQEELIGYPGPDGLIWVQEQTGNGGFVSGGLASSLDTFTTFACEGGGSIEVAFRLDNHPDRDPAPFTLDCPAGSPSRVTVPLGTGLHGGFGATVTASSPSIRWGATVVQPE
ncbi:hypothetical protein OG756_11175 [Streptomyces sp. NBC_01310]|uniref:hypothetical protein n=1 Tax=unclassified Streptomyces TaxID=2593676 RepID=UPI002DDA7BC2|nr:hypothetical protein [Streptomyces sp. NBC_01294]WRZ59881.1 hypothetical protein OG534_27365 [Streptomyces sp. NBC_01294]WSJ58513.1 hypothetical protein OG756_11175 [Streptomyces sp. NBC_01310]